MECVREPTTWQDGSVGPFGDHMTMSPFPFPEHLRQRLPAPLRDGNHYVDVLVAGTWHGILVVNAAGLCIGVSVRRRIEESPLSFAADQIEDVRRASALNRLLAALPMDLWDGAVLTIVVLSPMALLMSFLISPLFATFSVAACGASIFLMYLAPGFPLIRLPVAVLGLGQILSGIVLLVRSLS